MTNFSELLNNSIVKPLKQRLASLQNADAEILRNVEKNTSDLATSNQRQQQLDQKLKTLSQQVQQVSDKLDKVESELKSHLASYEALLGALENLKWIDEEVDDDNRTAPEKTDNISEDDK